MLPNKSHSLSTTCSTAAGGLIPENEHVEPDNSPHDPLSLITLDELLSHGLHLVTYKPRYSNLHFVNMSGPSRSLFEGKDEALVGVMIAGHLPELAEMADAMTDSGEYCQHIENMLYNTPYFPHGEGHTFQEALDKALIKINKFSKRQWFDYAIHAVERAPSDYAKIREKYINWEPLPTIEQLTIEWG